ncbi:MAG TPA: hypothetical protein VIV60_28120 [Polyangiaceae bacterium]
MHGAGWLLLVLFGVAACDNESTLEIRSNCFDACLDASADLDLEGQLAIASSLRDAFAEARAGLSVTADVSNALGSFVHALVKLSAGMPNGLTYEGQGLYSARPNPSTRLELRFYLPSNTSFGSAGDLIDFNLFNAANYFASLGVESKASISLSGVSTSLRFTFDGLGKGAELLGIAPGAQSPIGVDESAFSQQLSKVIVHARVMYSRESELANIGFELAPASRSASGYGNRANALSISNFVGQGLTFDQTLTLEAASLSVLNQGAAFDGTLRIASGSPSFGFHMLFNYAASATADVVFGCQDVALSLPE